MNGGLDRKRASGAEQNSEDGAEARKGSGLAGPYWTMAGVVHSLQVLERNGGDDETRTRDLCRDRVAVGRNSMKPNGADSPSLVV
jgi:hypothetical protein